MSTDELLESLEPSAFADKAITEAGALTSIAISLKRIADVLQGNNASITDYISGIEESLRGGRS